MICNSLSCRKDLSLEGSAVVTTCSHIFCVQCANDLFTTPQVCPACETSLPDSDDAVQSALNPPDAYKTSVLSGLSPTLILDIASRALNFYTYQMSQENAFQALVTKNAQERIAVLEAQCNNLVREATSEISLLKERVEATERDLDVERHKNHDLTETHKANAKAYNKLKAQYDAVRQRSLLASIQGGKSSSTAFDPDPSRQFNTQNRAPLPTHQQFNGAFGGVAAGGPIPLSNNPGGISSAQRPRRPLHDASNAANINPTHAFSTTTQAYTQVGGTFRREKTGGGGSMGSAAINQASQPRRAMPTRSSHAPTSTPRGSSAASNRPAMDYIKGSGAGPRGPARTHQAKKAGAFRPAGFAA